MGIPIRKRIQKKRRDTHSLQSRADNETHLQVLVSDQHGKELLFRLRRESPLYKLFSFYSSKEKLANLTFYYEGKLLDGTETPTDLRMKSRDFVQVRDG